LVVAFTIYVKPGEKAAALAQSRAETQAK